MFGKKVWKQDTGCMSGGAMETSALTFDQTKISHGLGRCALGVSRPGLGGPRFAVGSGPDRGERRLGRDFPFCAGLCPGDDRRGGVSALVRVLALR